MGCSLPPKRILRAAPQDGSRRNIEKQHRMEEGKMNRGSPDEIGRGVLAEALCHLRNPKEILGPQFLICYVSLPAQGSIWSLSIRVLRGSWHWFLKFLPPNVQTSRFSRRISMCRKLFLAARPSLTDGRTECSAREDGKFHRAGR